MHKSEVQNQIKEIYHSHNGVDGYRSMKVYLERKGYPYDNAPMERGFNTLKNECANLRELQTKESLYQTIEEFAYVEYNYVRPHSFNNHATPHEVRMTE